MSADHRPQRSHTRPPPIPPTSADVLEGDPHRPRYPTRDRRPSGHGPSTVDSLRSETGERTFDVTGRTVESTRCDSQTVQEKTHLSDPVRRTSTPRLDVGHLCETSGNTQVRHKPTTSLVSPFGVGVPKTFHVSCVHRGRHECRVGRLHLFGWQSSPISRPAVPVSRDRP